MAFLFLNQNRVRRERIFRNRSVSLLDTINPLEIQKSYRFSKECILEIVEKVYHDLSRETKRSSAIDVERQVLVTLLYLAKGDFLSEVAEIHSISVTSASRIIHSTVNAINTNLNMIVFPDSVTLKKEMERFYNMSQMPKVIGCIDGTLIPIIAPSNDESEYVCRKGFHAINVLAVCDSNMKFTALSAKWPGSVHDSFALRNSQLYTYLESGQHGGWLLGDSGFMLKPFLLTPFNKPASDAQNRYNRSHAATRVTIERSFGVLKSRFRCLSKTGGCLTFTPEKSCNIIKAACNLHNLAIDKRMPLEEEFEVEQDLAQELNFHNGDENSGKDVRNDLVRRHFQ